MDVEKLEKLENIQKRAPYGVRHIQYMLLFAVAVIAYGMRTTLNVGIIAMTSEDPPSENVPTYPEWIDKKNTMISSFFWGYICFQVVAGQIAKKYGPKLFLAAAIFVSATFSVFIPLFGAKFGYIGVIVCRVLQGMSQGFVVPSIHHLVSAWVPLADRAKVAGFIYAGQALGTVIAMPTTGYVSDSSVGWPAAFYIYGVVGYLWSLVWLIYGSDSPQKHKTITNEEIQYIQDGTISEETQNIPTPWLSIFTSVPFWAILICHMGHIWGFWTMLNEIPSYMENILGFKIESNGLLSALPYFVHWLLNFGISPIADYLITKNITTLAVSRKVFNSIGVLVPAVALIALSFVGSTEKVATIVIFVIAVGLNSAVFSGFHVNHIDIAPAHAGTLMGITNSASTLSAIVAPLSIDLIMSITGYNEGDKALWNIVFCLAAAIYATAGIFYNISGSGVVQAWNNLDSEWDKARKKSVDAK